ncbi:MAG TPA: hypothetical protein VE090_01225 [Methylomirabilota bacterium]|nr:hypothetical protein [Methylomirabilota bacterium]
MHFDPRTWTISFGFRENLLQDIKHFIEKKATLLLFFILTMVSITSFLFYYANGLGLAYNDARSHLDIGRRVVENLKPGFAQLGSVWLPLPHLLMMFTIWNDFMWHSGLSGALQSMVSFIVTGIIIYQFLKKLQVDLFGRLVGVLIFIFNLNILYMQSTAMTELLLLGTMTVGVYELMMWHKEEKLVYLIRSAFWIMLSTLIRYDGWFLFIFAAGLIAFHTIRKYGYKTTEGVLVLFCTLGGFGIFLWLVWNQLIFKDAFYFISGPYSAAAQQNQLAQAGVLATKKNLPLSLQTYIYALVYNANLFIVLLSCFGAVLLWFDKKIQSSVRIATFALIAPFFFNVLALYLGQSVLFVQGLSGTSWFNVRYGLMMIPSIAIFVGYLFNRLKSLRFLLLGLVLFVSIFTFANKDAVTIDDARVGASGKNVSEVSGWLRDHATNQNGYVLISVASHDAIVFSSGLPMKKFIHEGTGQYWDLATAHPEKWVRWIIVRTHDTNDLTYKVLQFNPAFNQKYTLVNHFPFADIYELKSQYVPDLEPLPVLTDNK